ncbi:MAG: integrase [Frateuria sp.]|nr:integrase [Frateuria sp.]
MGRRRKNPDTGLEPRVYQHHGAFFYVHPADPAVPGSKPKWERLGTDRDAANRVAKVYNDPKGLHGTMVYWLDQFVIDCGRRVDAGMLAKRTLEDYREAIGSDDAPGPLRTYFTPEPGQPWMTPPDVTPDVVQDYIDAGLELKRARRANLERAALSSCFGWLLRKKKCPGLMVNPCLRASGVQRNPEKARDRYVTDEEYAAVWAESPRSVRLMMELAYRTLQRPESDIVLWDSTIIVRRDGARMLHFQQHKTRQWMLISVTPELAHLLPADDGNVRRLREPLVQRLDGEHYTYGGLSGMLRVAIDVANVRRAARKQVPIASFGFRDLKGKGATDMWRAGVPIEQIQALCGHTTKVTTERYVKQRWREAVQPNTLSLRGKNTA